VAKTIPEGYRENYRGDLVLEKSIKDIDLVRDRLTIELVQKAMFMRDLLLKLKAEMHDDIAAFVALSAEQYGVNFGGKKGSVTLTSFDGRYKVMRAMADEIVFDERLQAAKALIDECLQDWTTGANQYLVTLVNDVFRVDKNGDISTGRVLGLRRHNVDDDRWKRAMDAISDALQVVGSKSYIRVYERVEDTDKYKQVSLDIAGV
jgi:hypothetical protein